MESEPGASVAKASARPSWPTHELSERPQARDSIPERETMKANHSTATEINLGGQKAVIGQADYRPLKAWERAKLESERGFLAGLAWVQEPIDRAVKSASKGTPLFDPYRGLAQVAERAKLKSLARAARERADRAGADLAAMKSGLWCLGFEAGGGRTGENLTVRRAPDRAALNLSRTGQARSGLYGLSDRADMRPHASTVEGGYGSRAGFARTETRRAYAARSKTGQAARGLFVPRAAKRAARARLKAVKKALRESGLTALRRKLGAPSPASLKKLAAPEPGPSLAPSGPPEPGLARPAKRIKARLAARRRKAAARLAAWKSARLADADAWGRSWLGRLAGGQLEAKLAAERASLARAWADVRLGLKRALNPPAAWAKRPPVGADAPEPEPDAPQAAPVAARMKARMAALAWAKTVADEEAWALRARLAARPAWTGPGVIYASWLGCQDGGGRA